MNPPRRRTSSGSGPRGVVAISEMTPPPADLDRVRANVGVRFGAGVREHRPPGLARQPAAVRVVDVDRGRGALEQPRLGAVVVLHVGMEVEVVLREVGERGGGEPHTGHALELERVRRHLHHTGRVAGVGHPPQHGLEVDALGSRPDDRLHAPADALLDGAEQPGRARPPRVRRGAGRPSSSCRSSGDADDVERGGRVAVERVGGGGHRPPRRLDQDLRRVDGEVALDDERRSAPADRLAGEVVAVGGVARDADVQGSGHDSVCPIGHRRDLPVSPPPDGTRADGLDQGPKLHPRGNPNERCGRRACPGGSRGSW